VSWEFRPADWPGIHARWRAEIAKETPKRVLKFLTTWPDRVLDADHDSAPGGPCGDDLVLAYLKLRRKAPGWNPRKMGNNHSSISPVQPTPLASPPGERTCERCGATLTSQRTGARFCSGTCQRAAHRAGAPILV